MWRWRWHEGDPWRVLYAPDGDGGGGGGDGDDGTGDGDGDAGKADAGKGTESLEALREELARARHEAGKYRQEAQKLKRQGETEQERRERELTELREGNTTLTSSLRELRLENAVLKRASTLGIVDPDVATLLVGRELGEEAWDGDRIRTDSLDKALRALVKERPFLVRQGSAAAGDGSSADRQDGGGQPVDMNARLRLAARRGPTG